MKRGTRHSGAALLRLLRVVLVGIPAVVALAIVVSVVSGLFRSESPEPGLSYVSVRILTLNLVEDVGRVFAIQMTLLLARAGVRTSSIAIGVLIALAEVIARAPGDIAFFVEGWQAGETLLAATGVLLVIVGCVLKIFIHARISILQFHAFKAKKLWLFLLVLGVHFFINRSILLAGRALSHHGLEVRVAGLLNIAFIVGISIAAMLVLGAIRARLPRRAPRVVPA